MNTAGIGRFVLRVGLFLIACVIVVSGARCCNPLANWEPVDYNKCAETQERILKRIASALDVSALPKSVSGAHMYREGGRSGSYWIYFELDPKDITGFQNALDVAADFAWKKNDGTLEELQKLPHWPPWLTDAPVDIRAWWDLRPGRFSFWYQAWGKGTHVSAFRICLFDEKGGRFWFHDFHV